LYRASNEEPPERQEVNMKKLTVVTTLVALAVAVAPTMLMAQDASETHRRGIRPAPTPEVQAGRQLALWFGEYLDLDLADDQLIAIQTIVELELPAIERLSTSMAEARHEFLAGVEPGVFDADAVRHFTVTQATLYVELMVATAKLKAEVLAVLNADQREILSGRTAAFDPLPLAPVAGSSSAGS
jgi:Spy/CpxP family protein refolding chaperone